MSFYVEPEQLALFEELLEAWRSAPRDQRHPFLFIRTMGAEIVQGNGINRAVPDGDVDVLRDEGLLAFRDDSFTIPPRAVARYQEWKTTQVEPSADVEDQLQRYLDSEQFRGRYPESYARWAEAAVLLWGEDSDQELSTIGHKCREAIQDFAIALLRLYEISDANPDKAKTRDRFSSVINARRAIIGNAKSELLDALFDYWKALVSSSSNARNMLASAKTNL